MFTRGDTCYILENNMNVRAARIINKQGKFCTIQLVGSCGAIRLPETRLFTTGWDALNSKKKKVEIDNVQVDTNQKKSYGYVDVFAGKRHGRNPHSPINDRK